jgi:glycosyltransferase involved in cell wall biosynthesis
VRDGIGLRGRVAGLDDASRVVLWGGGVYDWLDPLPVIEAVAGLVAEIPDLRLVFMGTTHPNPAVPASSMLSRARALVHRLDADEVVLFHEGWVPYDERHNVLLDAEVGVSGHPDHIETMLAYRTRILDYIWAGLPVVTTAGDALGDLVDERELGRTVPPGDAPAVAAALRALLLDPDESAMVREHLAAAAPSMQWSAVLQPLLEHCASPRPAADRDVPEARQLRRIRAPRGYDRVERAREVIASGRASLEEGGPRGLAAKVRGRLLHRPSA